MAFAVDWSMLGKPVNIAAEMQKGFDEGRARRDKDTLQNALDAYAHNSDNESARRTIFKLNPQMGVALEDQAFQRGERTRAGEFRSALGDLLTGGAGPQPNVLAPMVAGQAVPQVGPVPTMPLSEAAAAPGGALATPPQAAPQIRPAALERAMRADPEKFLTFQGKRTELDTKRLEQLRDLNESAMQLLGGVYDDATLQAGKARARAMYQQFGMPTEAIDQIPDTYSPELVRSLQMQGMDTSKQLGAIARENKLEWDIQDDLADNERADRNTDSMVETRQGQLANVRRGQDLTHSRGLRGQDISSRDRNRGVDVRRETTLRGQDLTDARGRRGQDITDRRGRESASFRGAGGKRGGAAAAAARILNPQTGRAAVLKNGEWVDEQTGRPLQ